MMIAASTNRIFEFIVIYRAGRNGRSLKLLRFHLHCDNLERMLQDRRTVIPYRIQQIYLFTFNLNTHTHTNGRNKQNRITIAWTEQINGLRTKKMFCTYVRWSVFLLSKADNRKLQLRDYVWLQSVWRKRLTHHIKVMRINKINNALVLFVFHLYLCISLNWRPLWPVRIYRGDKGQ